MLALPVPPLLPTPPALSRRAELPRTTLRLDVWELVLNASSMGLNRLVANLCGENTTDTRNFEATNASFPHDFV